MSEKSVNDLVISAINYIRNKRSRPSLNAIFGFVKREKNYVTESEFKNSVLNLIADGKIFNKSTGEKKESFCINDKNSVIENSIISETSIINTPSVINSVGEIETPTIETIEDYRDVNFSTKQLEIKETASMTPKSKRDSMLGTINDLVEQKITESMSPFIDNLEDLLHSYDKLLNERELIDTTNRKLVDENQKLKYVEANAKAMESEITFLRSELETKNDIIKTLIANNSLHPSSDIPSEEYKINKIWTEVKGNKTSLDQQSHQSNNGKNANNFKIPLSNRFEGLSDKLDFMKDDNYDDAKEITNSFGSGKPNVINGVFVGSSDKTGGSNARKRPDVVTNLHPENDTIQRRERLVPGNSSYSKIVKTGKRTVIFCSSIPKRINMNQFDKLVRNGEALKRPFPGCVASDLKYHALPTLKEKSPDRVIIHVGSNNLTKKSWQSPNEIVNEIISVVQVCRDHGVNDIFVSGLTYRPAFQGKIDEINSMLMRNANNFNYKFIDNGSIRKEHLWRDDLHLNNEGLSILANNYLTHLNAYNSQNHF